jgi:spermidine/putrescine transport system permease protein
VAAEDVEEQGARRGTWQPWALLGPGMFWLLVFFVLPLVTLLQISLSTQASRFTQEFSFDWELSNYTDAISEHGSIFVRSFVYAGIATLACILIGYPMAYLIAFRGGRWRNLLLGLVIAPFFTSYLIRTIAWSTILADNGPVLNVARDLHLMGLLDALSITQSDRLLATRTAVIGGLAYNFLPFMILPIYVSLEKIDLRLTEAAKDLYNDGWSAFRKVVLPLSLPGVFAGTLLTFIPAAGDFVNARFLGGPNNTMIGTVVQDRFLVQLDYPTAAALSFVLMVVITAGVLVYARILGTDDLA